MVIMETIGVWTPFAKGVLRSITARSIIRNGLLKSVAYTNLIEHMPVKLFVIMQK